MFFFLQLNGVYFVFFFFQAEDGIRDKLVTGVQTCALPISAQVRVNADRTAIIGGSGSSDKVGFRVTQLRAELERATFGVDEDVLTERIGSLSGKVAVIRVGAP